MPLGTFHMELRRHQLTHKTWHGCSSGHRSDEFCGAVKSERLWCTAAGSWLSKQLYNSFECMQVSCLQLEPQRQTLAHRTAKIERTPGSSNVAVRQCDAS